MPERSPIRLRTVLGRYPHLDAIRSGALSDPRVTLDFVDVEPVPKAFAPMVRRLEYDLSEMAVVSAMQAFAVGKPLILLPAVVASRFQRGCLIRHRDSRFDGPHTLVGQRIGVRAFTQTTGMWVRAALYEDHRIQAQDMRWCVSEEPHVAEYASPAFVELDRSDRTLPQQLRTGEIAAAVMGADLPKDPEFVPVLPDHRAADRAWYERHGFMPINHIVMVRADMAEKAPEAVRAAYGLIERALARPQSPAGEPRQTLVGIEAVRAPLAFIIEEMRRQELLPSMIDVDALLEPARRLLGA